MREAPLPFATHLNAPADFDAALATFHPLVQRWFTRAFGEATPPQREAWPRIAGGENVLITAPTGSGKTLAAFLACVDRLVREAVAGTLAQRTHIVYVSPLKALSNDVQKNLLVPLAGLEEEAAAAGLPPLGIEVLVRTGDTPAAERQRMAKRPPHILITTPESLYLCMTAAGSRAALAEVDTIVIDEIHALVRDKRGSHMALSLARLEALTGRAPQMIGLSATTKPLERVAEFLVGPGRACHIVRAGHMRPWNMALEIPDGELGAVASHEMWGQIYDRLVTLSENHRTILIFTSTRKLSERIAHDLGERIGSDLVMAHHGSMARELRLRAEQRLKAGQLRVMVATASLELGIDIGNIDLVCNVGSPRAISVLLQRVGRAGHHLHGISKGILFAMTRDELVECSALLWAVKKGELDALVIPEKPLDVLAQHIVAACVERPWAEAELLACVRKTYTYRDLTDAEFESVIEMLANGPSENQRQRALIFRDRTSSTLFPRKHARLVALQNGGAIPDTFTYPVIAQPEGVNVGTLDEDFAVESMAGDVFLLGTTAWRIQRVMGNAVHVEFAGGQQPTVPFWRGEAPSRTRELSYEVGALREKLAKHPAAMTWLQQEVGLEPDVARVLLDYIRAGMNALGAMPTTDTIIAERFFDDAGGMQLIIHAPFGGRINRAWGMALRKRFCRSFDFELQAAAGDDGVLLSLGAQHSFPLKDIFDFLTPDTVEDVLTQAILQAPIFGTRFRWNATRALQLERQRNGERVPPPLQRARSDDLLASVFPAQVGCQDNHGGGDVELPDHPLVKEAMHDCLHEAMDVDGLKAVLQRLRDGSLATLAIDVPEPSLFAHQHLNSAPYTYLDDAPLEERRARTVALRHGQRPEDVAAFGALDADAIAQVVADAAPFARDPLEALDALVQLVVMEEVPHFDALVATHRAAFVRVGERAFCIARERLAAVKALYPDGVVSPAIEALPGESAIDNEAATLLCVRGHMDIAGPILPSVLATRLALPESRVLTALAQLENQGTVLRGRFSPGVTGEEFCDRRLLQRIHRLTVGRLRQEIAPLSGQDFMRFLLRWHHLDGATPHLQPRGRAGIRWAIERLEGWLAPAATWEHHLLKPRVQGYEDALLSELCLGGEVVWGRMTDPQKREPGPKRGAVVDAALASNTLAEEEVARRAPTRISAMTFARRSELDWLLAASGAAEEPELPADVSEGVAAVWKTLRRRGASFASELATMTGASDAATEEALWDLLCRGLVSADDVGNLRLLCAPQKRREQKKRKRTSQGRWSILAPAGTYASEALAERAALLYLQRYGIVFRDVCVREPTAPRWRELLFCYRRMEARGEVRGGRFVSEVVGEQFALPEAVDAARAIRREPVSGRKVVISGVDPLNLTTVITSSVRVPRLLGEQVVFIDGVAQPALVSVQEDSVRPINQGQ